MGDTTSLGALFGAAGVWVGFLLTLFIASLLIRDNGLAGFAQHLLVGVSLGYAVVVAIQLVLRPRLFAPLWQGEVQSLWLWAPLGLGLLLLATGIERSLRQGRVSPASASRRRMWSVIGAIPVALLIGIGVAAGLVGLFQGTIFPLFWQAAVAGLWWTTSPTGFWGGALTLLLTVATLLSLTLHPARHVTHLPRLLRMGASGLIWLGQRALWVAAGMIFARLFASRLSLVIERVSYLLASIQQTGLQQWLESIWLNMTQ